MKTTNNIKMKGLVAVSALFYAVSSSVAMTVTAMDSADEMAQSLVGEGVEISNASYTGNTLSAGYFTGGYAEGNDISEGIILTTGKASSAETRLNLSDSRSYMAGTAGDDDLASLIPGVKTYDASILTFDFVSSGDSVYFNFAFASEEYTEWVGSGYNDVFGFFIDGENVALIPGTDTPVSVNTVSDVTNSDLYNDNGRSVGYPYAFEYDGFTDVFTAVITGLEPGETYTISLGIADAGDSVYDSAVFIEAGTFSTETTADIPAPSGAPEPSVGLLAGMGALGAFIRIRKTRKK